MAIPIVAAITLAFHPGWVRDVRDQFLPKRWGVVEPGKIYRSGQISGTLIKRMLEENHIERGIWGDERVCDGPVRRLRAGFGRSISVMPRAAVPVGCGHCGYLIVPATATSLA